MVTRIAKQRSGSYDALKTTAVQSTVTRPSFSIVLADRTHSPRCTPAWRTSSVPARIPAELTLSTETSRRPTKASFGRSTPDDRPLKDPLTVMIICSNKHWVVLGVALA